MAHINKELDARRLLCPLPVIRAQDAVATMQAGERLLVASKMISRPGAESMGIKLKPWKTRMMKS